MKNLLISFLCFAFSSVMYSQQANFSKGDIIKDRQFLIDKNEISTIDDNGNFISIRPHRINGTLRNYYIEFFDELNFDSRVKVETENKTEILKVFIRKNKVHVLIKELAKKEVSLRFDLIDLNTREVLRKKLININKKENPEAYKSLKNDANVYLDISNNFLISFPLVEDKKLATQVYLFNKNFNKTLERKIYPKSDIPAKRITFLNSFIHNNLTFLLFNYKDESDKKFYQLIKINDNDANNELIIPVEHDFYEIVNSSIDNNNFIISGLVSEKRKGSYKGFSYYKFDLVNFQLLEQKYSPFMSDDISKYFLGFFKSNRDIDIRDIFVDTSGNTYLVGQFYKLRKQAAPIGFPVAAFSLGAGTVFITYNPIHYKYKVYDDIMIAKIDTKGKLIWEKLLELKETKKIKSTSLKRDSSYFTFFKNDQIHILMNGYINMDKDRLVVKQDKRLNKTSFYDILIDQEGKITPTVLLSNFDSDIIFKADKATITNKNIFILGQGNIKKQLIKINL